MYKKKGYKRPFWTIEDGPVTGKTGFPHVVYSPSLLFRLNSNLEQGGSPCILTCPGF